MLGGTYALLGIGLTLIFGIMRVVNFTHGELYAFGAYMMYMLVMLTGANFFVALVLAVVLGVVARRGDRARAAAQAARRRHRHHHAGDDRRLDRAAERRAARLDRRRQVDRQPVPFRAPLVIGPVSVAWIRVFVFAVALALIAATYALIHHTRLGKAMRATFQDRDTAALMGVQIGAVHTATFALGSGLAAAAGALLGPVFVVYPTMGDLAVAKAFAIVILGGLGSIAGATAGGFILALAEELGAGYISSGYRDAMGFLLIIAILIFKPTGLFARKERIG